MAQLKDKVPPHNLDAEQATLGALLLDWDVLGDVLRYLRPERFYSLQNQRIFSAMLSLYGEGVRGDLITLIEKLRSLGDLDAAGGLAYVSALTNTVGTSANIEYYAKLVLDLSVRRELIKTSSKIVQNSHDETLDSRTVLEEAQKGIFDLTDINATHAIYEADTLVKDAIERIEKLYSNKHAFTGVPSGFQRLDEMTNGFQDSEFIIIGARPSMGKTAIALSMFHHIAVEQSIPAAFFSLEMAHTTLMQRLLSQDARIRADLLRSGFLKREHFTHLMHAAGRLYQAPIYIVDTPNMKLLDLRAIARRLKIDKKVKIIFIDYIGLIQSENSSIPRHEQIAEISRSLKSLARELEIPIVVLSQVRRDAELKEPTLADLRESGSIEQDADVVMFIHRERQSGVEDATAHHDAKLIVAKQRNGPIGHLALAFIPAYATFENLSNQ